MKKKTVVQFLQPEDADSQTLAESFMLDFVLHKEFEVLTDTKELLNPKGSSIYGFLAGPFDELSYTDHAVLTVLGLVCKDKSLFQSLSDAWKAPSGLTDSLLDLIPVPASAEYPHPSIEGVRFCRFMQWGEDTCIVTISGGFTEGRLLLVQRVPCFREGLQTPDPDPVLVLYAGNRGVVCYSMYYFTEADSLFQK